MISYRQSPENLHFSDDEKTFLTLQLPLLAWTGNLSTTERAFLKKLGVREHPALLELLSLCTHKDSTISKTAFEYLIGQFDTAYKKEYKGMKREEIPAIIPTALGTRVQPFKAFFNELGKKFNPKDLQILCRYMDAFPVDEMYRDSISKLGVPHHVPITGLIQKIIKNPPTQEEAFLVFEFAYHFQSEISSDLWKQLQHAEFVPHG